MAAARYLICLIAVFAASVTPQINQSGNLRNYVSDIVDNIPGSGTNKFAVPDSQQIAAFEKVFADILTGKFGEIQAQVAVYGYNFIRFYDTASKDTLYILKEIIPVQRGWGTYIYCASSKNNLMIEIPHPLWDRYSWDLGIRAYSGCRAQWYIMAGTHRYSNSDTSSDMAHRTKSIFHAAHRIVAASSALQVHGFNSSSPIYSGYPDVVISNGTLYPQTIHYTLKDNYTAQQFSAGVFSYSTYSQFYQLGATQNVQGQWSASNNRKFIHAEHDQPLRYDTSIMKKAAAALVKTFALPNYIIEEDINPRQFKLHQNFPNPFNPSTRIQFTIAIQGNYRLAVYNVLGREIKRLHEGFLATGSYSAYFDAEGISAGVYLCVLSGSAKKQTIKLSVIK